MGAATVYSPTPRIQPLSIAAVVCFPSCTGPQVNTFGTRSDGEYLAASANNVFTRTPTVANGKSGHGSEDMQN